MRVPSMDPAQQEKRAERQIGRGWRNIWLRKLLRIPPMTDWSNERSANRLMSHRSHCVVRPAPPHIFHQVWLRTEEYLKDALGSVVTDIEDMAVNLLAFVNAQVNGGEIGFISKQTAKFRFAVDGAGEEGLLSRICCFFAVSWSRNQATFFRKGSISCA